MKVIDLLNKIVKEDRLPKKIKIYDDIYEYDTIIDDYVSIEDKDYFKDSYYIFEMLNDEVEIIEEPKEELEEIELLNTPYTKSQNDFAVENKINELIENQNIIIRELKANKKQ